MGQNCEALGLYKVISVFWVFSSFLQYTADREGEGKKETFRWQVDDWQLWRWRRRRMWDVRCVKSTTIFCQQEEDKAPLFNPLWLCCLTEQMSRLNKNLTMLKNVKVARERHERWGGILRKITPVRSCFFALCSSALLMWKSTEQCNVQLKGYTVMQFNCAERLQFSVVYNLAILKLQFILVSCCSVL